MPYASRLSRHKIILVYDALARSLIEPVPERVAYEVSRARERNPRLSKSELSDAVVRRAAFRSGIVGAFAAAPSGWLGVLPIAADFSYQVLSLHRTALAVPEALRRPTSPAERALASAASLAAAGVSFWLREKAVRSAGRALRGRSPSVRSAFHALIGGAFSAAAVAVLGRAAREYCRRTSAPR